MGKLITVIGGGISGLNAGIELLQKGHKVTIIEKNDSVGGLCSGYDVNGFYIDACIHWLMGTNKGNQIYDLWKNMDAFNDDVKIIRLENFVTIEYQDTKVRMGRDLEKTRQEWLSIAPEDKRNINKFFSIVSAMEKLMNYTLKCKTKKSFTDLVKVFYKSPSIIKSLSMSREEYAKRFKNPALRFAITNMMTGYNNMFFLFDIYSLFSQGNADIPSGGAKYMVERIKNRFLSLGGTLLLNEEVTELEIKKDKVFAVKTSKNHIFYPDVVVSSSDPRHLLKNLLKDEYKINKLEKADKRINKNPISSCFNVYVTIEGDISKIDGPTLININPIQVGASKVDYLLIRPYNYDPEYFVKENKTVVSLFVDQNHLDYHYYSLLNKDGLKEVEQKIIDDFIAALIDKYPEFKGRVNYLTHFGPIELEKRTNTSYGALQAYSLTDLKSFYFTEGRVKGIKNLYCCGQWTRCIGGTPTALLTSHQIAKKIK